MLDQNHRVVLFQLFSARCSTVKRKKLKTRINFHTSHIAKLIPIAGGNRQQSKGMQESEDAFRAGGL